MNLVWFEYEWLLDDIRENQKEQQTRAEAQEKEQAAMHQQMRSNPYGNIKPPTMPNFSMPSFSTPKINL